MKRPLISCIVPVYNGESYLQETLDSILAQSYGNFEVIVVDDGSTDGTAAVVAEYGNRVRYVRQANAGETAARNHGLSLARGELVSFLDADDLWLPEKLSTQAARFEARPDLDLCFTYFENFWTPEQPPAGPKHLQDSISRPFTGYCIGTVLARADAFVRFGKFADDGSRIPQNTIWFLHASEQGARLETIAEILMRRRLHPQNMSRRHGLDMYFHILKEWRDYQARRATNSDERGEASASGRQDRSTS